MEVEKFLFKQTEMISESVTMSSKWCARLCYCLIFVLVAIGAMFTALLIYVHVTFDDKKGCIADRIYSEYSMDVDEFNVTDMLVITMPGVSSKEYQFYFNNKLGGMSEYDLMEFNFTEYYTALPDLCVNSSFDKMIVNIFRYEILKIYLMNTFECSGSVRSSGSYYDSWAAYNPPDTYGEIFLQHFFSLLLTVVYFIYNTTLCAYVVRMIVDCMDFMMDLVMRRTHRLMRSKRYPYVYVILYLLYIFLILILGEMLLESGLSFDQSFIPSTLLFVTLFVDYVSLLFIRSAITMKYFPKIFFFMYYLAIKYQYENTETFSIVNSISFLFWSFGILFLFFLLFDTKSISYHQITETALRAYKIKDTRPEPEVIPVILNLFVVPSREWIPVDAVEQREIEEMTDGEEEEENDENGGNSNREHNNNNNNSNTERVYPEGYQAPLYNS